MDLQTSAHETMKEELQGKESGERQEAVPKISETKEIPKGNLSLHISHAPVAEVIRTLAEMTGKNVAFSGEIKETVTASLDHVTPEEAMSSILTASGLVVRSEGSTLVIFGKKEAQNAAVQVKSYRLSYADAKEISKALRALVTEGHVTYSASANSVLVSGSPFELMQAEDLISQMDVPEKQVKVEAEVIAVNKSYAKELGVDWDFKSITGSAEYNRDSWSDQQYVTDEAGNIRYDEDGNPRVRNISHEGWEVRAPEGFAGISYGKSITGHPYTFFFQAKLNAMLSQGKAKILAKPNVVTMNGRKAEILIGSKIPVIVEHLDNGVKTTATEYKDAGIKLTYTPIISKNNEITASVEAEVSTPYLVPEMKAYRIITRSANTNVRLHSGEMLTIGGLIDKEESKTFRKVPILGDIPILGKLFQSKGHSSEEAEIVIIIRANIIS